MSLPGNTSLPSSKNELEALAALESADYKYKVEDFFKKPKTSGYQISPNGQFLSFKKRNDEGKTDLWLRNLNTQEETLLLKEGEDVIRGYFWVNDTHILYGQDQGGNEQYHIYDLNIITKTSKDLTPFENVVAMVIRVLREEENTVLIQMNKNIPQLFEPYKLNIETGELIQLFENTDLTAPIADYTFDKQGVLRAYNVVRGVDSELFYRIDEEFKSIKHIPMSDVYSILGFDYTSQDPDIAYIANNTETDLCQIERVNLKTGQCLEVLHNNDEYDVQSFGVSRHRGYELDYFSYEGERHIVTPVSKTYTAWLNDLETQLRASVGTADIDIIDRSDDESCLLVIVSSDRLVGQLYTYYPAEKKLTLIHHFLDHLKIEDMSLMKPITFKSRDGLTLHGYITLPNNKQADEKVPMVVIPHGGPQGIRDSWGFDPQAQLFASRGYATLAVNFRISGGYGKSFLTAGFGQVGRKCMDDVEDGIAYVIKQGWVDPKKIAIYGGSHGGYAVLRGLTKTPDLYACGIDYVGVSNLFTFMKTIPPYWMPFLPMIKRYWYDEDIPEERAIMEEVSPALHTDKIIKPLFVVQGANDPRVNIDEADQIVSSLRARGVDVPYMVKYDEGHGFAKESNRLELYKAMMGFLSKYLKD
ncbi:MAG: S9 family peptidase [Alcaligenaceae bacterium]|nr:S9 family peptidase [Alcaligenaceae bacterium]